MVRGGRYNSRGGRGGGSSYRGSNSNYRGNSGHSSYNNYSSSQGNGARYGEYGNSYDSRGSSRYLGSSDRYLGSRPENHKRQYVPSRDRSPDRKRSRNDRKAQKEVSNLDDDEREVDLQQFMTVDSIGDVDDHGAEHEEGDKKTATDEANPKLEIIVGNEHMKKVEVYYCELCRFYLPYKEEQEAALKKHCHTRSHLRSYLRFKENQNLRLAAEKIHRRHQEKREAKKEKAEKEKVVAKNTESEVAKEVIEDEEDAVDDKIWADVDKDLGELLQEAGTGNANDDEDEDSTTTTERYDRFKNSGKSSKVKESDLAKKLDNAEKVKPKEEETTEDGLMETSTENTEILTLNENTTE